MYLSGEAYSRYLARSADVSQRVTQTAVSRMLRSQQAAHDAESREADVASVPDLFRVSAADANVLGTFMERLEVAEGTVVVRQADAGDALYLIASGEAEVRVKSPSGQAMTVARLAPGEYFGEVALVAGGYRIADVVAMTPMTLARLSREGYERFVAHSSAIEQQLAITAATRASATTRKLISEH
jgi:CRP-like cAMP-binding protein